MAWFRLDFVAFFKNANACRKSLVSRATSVRIISLSILESRRRAQQRFPLCEMGKSHSLAPFSSRTSLASNTIRAEIKKHFIADFVFVFKITPKCLFSGDAYIK